MFLIVYKQEISCHKVSHCSSSLFTAFSCCQASHSSLWLLNAAVILKRHYQQKQSQKFVITLVLNYLPLKVSLSRTSTNAQHCCFITVWLSQNKTSSWLFLKSPPWFSDCSSSFQCRSVFMFALCVSVFTATTFGAVKVDLSSLPGVYSFMVHAALLGLTSWKKKLDFNCPFSVIFEKLIKTLSPTWCAVSSLPMCCFWTFGVFWKWSLKRQ